ncbi:MAG TPA: hypothetical protein VGS80_26210 [Ktedonobacterales bacterium]|nr:hypothetical protein [Ktedonobacterales bacterium]
MKSLLDTLRGIFGGPQPREQPSAAPPAAAGPTPVPATTGTSSPIVAVPRA